MDIFNFLFSIHDYNEVSHLFLSDWSMSMVFVCALFIYIMTIPFIFITKKKAEDFCKKYYPDEKILLISTMHEFSKIKMAIIWSFGYAGFVLPFIFFKNLNQIGPLTKDFMPLFLVGYTLLVAFIVILVSTSVYIFTDKTFIETIPYQWFIKAAKRKNKLPCKEIEYKNIKSAKYKFSPAGPILELELINDPFPVEPCLHKHIKQAQKIIESYLDKDGELDYDTKKETGNSSSD